LTAVNLLEQTAPDRYRFHDLLRVYAAERAAADEPEHERAQAVRRVLGWYLHTADAAARTLNMPGWHVPLNPPHASVQPLTFATHADAVQWCEAERGNLVAAIRQAADGNEHATAWQLAASLAPCFYLRQRWTERVLGNRADT
jgi:hypothetical protein